MDKINQSNLITSTDEEPVEKKSKLSEEEVALSSSSIQSTMESKEGMQKLIEKKQRMLVDQLTAECKKQIDSNILSMFQNLDLAGFKETLEKETIGKQKEKGTVDSECQTLDQLAESMRRSDASNPSSCNTRNAVIAKIFGNLNIQKDELRNTRETVELACQTGELCHELDLMKMDIKKPRRPNVSFPQAVECKGEDLSAFSRTKSASILNEKWLKNMFPSLKTTNITELSQQNPCKVPNDGSHKKLIKFSFSDPLKPNNRSMNNKSNQIQINFTSTQESSSGETVNKIDRQEIVQNVSESSLFVFGSDKIKDSSKQNDLSSKNEKISLNPFSPPFTPKNPWDAKSRATENISQNKKGIVKLGEIPKYRRSSETKPKVDVTLISCSAKKQQKLNCQIGEENTEYCESKGAATTALANIEKKEDKCAKSEATELSRHTETPVNPDLEAYLCEVIKKSFLSVLADIQLKNPQVLLKLTDQMVENIKSDIPKSIQNMMAEENCQKHSDSLGIFNMISQNIANKLFSEDDKGNKAGSSQVSHTEGSIKSGSEVNLGKASEKNSFKRHCAFPVVNSPVRELNSMMSSSVVEGSDGTSKKSYGSSFTVNRCSNQPNLYYQQNHKFGDSIKQQGNMQNTKVTMNNTNLNEPKGRNILNRLVQQELNRNSFPGTYSDAQTCRMVSGNKPCIDSSSVVQGSDVRCFEGPSLSYQRNQPATFGNSAVFFNQQGIIQNTNEGVHFPYPPPAINTNAQWNCVEPRQLLTNNCSHGNQRITGNYVTPQLPTANHNIGSLVNNNFPTFHPTVNSVACNYPAFQSTEIQSNQGFINATGRGYPINQTHLPRNYSNPVMHSIQNQEDIRKERGRGRLLNKN